MLLRTLLFLVSVLDHVIVKSGEGYTSWISTDLTIYDFFLESDTNNIRNVDKGLYENLLHRYLVFHCK